MYITRIKHLKHNQAINHVIQIVISFICRCQNHDCEDHVGWIYDFGPTLEPISSDYDLGATFGPIYMSNLTWANILNHNLI